MNIIGLSNAQMNKIKEVCMVKYVKEKGTYDELYYKFSSYIKSNMFATMFNSKVIYSDSNSDSKHNSKHNSCCIIV